MGLKTLSPQGSRLKTTGSKAHAIQGGKEQDGKDGISMRKHWETSSGKLCFRVYFGTSEASFMGARLRF